MLNFMDKIYDAWDNEKLVSDEKWQEKIYVPEQRNRFFTEPVSVDYRVVDRVMITIGIILVVAGAAIQFYG